MKIELLREFITVAELLNFSKASQFLYITQPQLSRHIIELEQELGTQLFIRNRHLVQLTYAGKAMLTEAKGVVDRYGEALRRMEEITSGRLGGLKVGFLNGVAKNTLTESIKKFNTIYPEIDLQYISLEYAFLNEAIKTGEIDISITLQTMRDKKLGLSEHVLYTDYYTLIISENHFLARKRSVCLSDLANLQFIMLASDLCPSYQEEVFKMCSSKGFSPKIIRSSSQIDTAILMVEVGLGAMLMPRYIKNNYSNSKVCFVDIEDRDACINVVVTWRKYNTNPLIESFLNELILINQDCSCGNWPAIAL